MDAAPLSCLEIRALSSTDLCSLTVAFAELEPLNLGQPWRTVPEDAFRPGTVRFAWCHALLLVFAELADDDIYNEARRLNEITWEKGDVFEIFLRNKEREEYLELHVTPDNQKLQLRIPSHEELLTQARQNSVIRAFRVEEEIFSSRVWVNREERCWRVFAAVPFREIGLPERPVGAEIFFSFGRYDHTRGVEHPVLSTTSAHQQINFHRQHEWGRLKIVEASA